MEELVLSANTTIDLLTNWLESHTLDAPYEQFRTEKGFITLQRATRIRPWVVGMLGHWNVLSGDSQTRYRGGPLIEFRMDRLAGERVEVRATCREPLVRSYFVRVLGRMATAWPETGRAIHAYLEGLLDGLFPAATPETPVNQFTGFVRSTPASVEGTLRRLLGLDKDAADKVGNILLWTKEGEIWRWRTHKNGHFSLQVQVAPEDEESASPEGGEYALPEDEESAPMKIVLRLEWYPLGENTEVVFMCYDSRWEAPFDNLVAEMEKRWPEMKQAGTDAARERGSKGEARRGGAPRLEERIDAEQRKADAQKYLDLRSRGVSAELAAARVGYSRKTLNLWVKRFHLLERPEANQANNGR